ncbi:hypothetical protein DMC64_41655 [Amycolatopsis sp. WAC 04197]|uniref:hypothetical protein n=1 Tax=Amycolatopsis sp. WAC 04197 TaxID=2203199 RepID=UPI000F797A13|nr:hypothetical protein [Amycolatopsis sp. WAC 04197]RSN38576.1 hypothetical protein DMC64_41655 [Amycolatopsis sp. WAC 04197]
MPRRRAAIRKRDGQWTVEIPGYGFASDIDLPVESQAAGLRLLRDRGYPQTAGIGGSARDQYGASRSDGISAIPRWEPFRYRF